MSNPDPSETPKASSCSYNFAAVQQAENEEIQKRADDPRLPLCDDLELGGAGHSRTVKDRLGLAFSGGGIRSACIGLGILQALSRARILGQAHYVSGISGGGYLLGWLAAWAKREGSLVEVEQRLGFNTATGTAPKPPEPPDYDRFIEPDPLRYLRRYSSYLTPRVGLLSGDTLAMVAIYLRNLMLNQLLLGSALVTGIVALQSGVPKLVVRSAVSGWWIGAAIGLIAICFCMAVRGTVVSLGRFDSSEKGSQDAAGPSIAFGIVASALAWVLTPSGYVKSKDGLLLWLAICCAVLAAIGFALTIRAVLSTSSRAVSRNGRSRVGVFGLSWLLCLLTALVLLCAFRTWVCCYVAGTDHASYLVLGLPAILLSTVWVSFLFVGVSGDALADAKREWMARQMGYIFAFSVAIGATMAIVVWGPCWVSGLIAEFGKPCVSRKVMAAILPGGWIFVVATGLFGGKSASTSGQDAGGTKSQKILEFVIAVAPPVFLLGLLLMLSWGTAATLVLLRDLIGSWSIAVLAGAATLIMVVLGLQLDVNEFSMHLFYRNRLVRAFLGASNATRQPNSFTGFAEDDDILLKELTYDAGYRGPYPLWGTTLNLTGGEELAWQERKGESFIYSPLFCGWDYFNQLHKKTVEPEIPLDIKNGSEPGSFGYRSTQSYERDADGALKPYYGPGKPEIEGYGGIGGAPYIGTAMAASGAAASPNMGYHTRPGVAALMAIFNVRLGWWTGNPRNATYCNKYAPPISYLVSELLGQANDRSRYVYLSDGGHFENLGIYELVRRRVRFIVCSDGDADRAFSFEDLGNAIERCRRDFGVEITLRAQRDLGASPELPYRKEHFAIGEIRYPGQQAKGILLYVKSSLTDDEPSDVLGMSAKDKSFPHDSTANQFFDESRFEAYRALGEHMMKRVLTRYEIGDRQANGRDRVMTLFAQLQREAEGTL